MTKRAPSKVARLVGACLALAAGLSTESPARAQPRARGLYEQLAAPDADRARSLAGQAALLMTEAEHALPSDWESVCRATLGLRTNTDSAASLRGKARALLELARDALRGQARLRSALLRLAKARELAPDDPALLHAHASALALWQEPGPAPSCSVIRRDAEAIELLTALERDHPSYAPERTSFELGVLLTRAQRFEDAAAAYERADALAVDDDEAAVARANLAETRMLAGDLERAIADYTRALSRTHAGRGYALTVWGLALALERSGDHGQALARLQRAFGTSQDALSVLRSEGVFFVPAYETHAYDALGHEARASVLEHSADRATALRAAIASHRAYLAGAANAASTPAIHTPGSGAAPDGRSGARYDATAREGLARTLAALQTLDKRTPDAARKKTRAKSGATP